ncbi:hypothetical protein AAZX31_11G192300 [Glycine max]|uniref:Uncharacterized protein n=1 Tax=Glycine max TaxID=3847 RepID=I1LLQ4_SOYBN|nr:spermidine hydroxycinnamoyl transferase [Glycine max]XP_003539368.1 spermidine hydroxycinnamoyl transferase [Glycine max]KAG4974702.1 hypothetical protein JHK87_031523 [Glycine soja]KAG4989270.1 hypothetical protein JHK85_032253 [Glycine max]KAG4994857.1 hypothetical protein JHK86_031684 [Glycine max]KAG5124861.1 hypothetical protein JHK82_031598 [Glycine max]KAG5124863.1 hypothetical protein JHK82_031600 [Glycine max]|eukprot:XP_003539366.1 spermidine hydroxycinnamoyl transferase [Glycine max]
MKTIVASYNITPNQPTPKDPLWLSDSDQIGVLGHVSILYIYRSAKEHNNNTVERMKNSLSKLLSYYYPVAGRLRLSKSGRMELDCNAKGVTLLEAETTNTFVDYGDDFSPSEFTDELIPKLDDTQQPIEEIPLLLVQLTRFHSGGDCEGLAIGVLLSHPLTDATGIIDFMNRWAKLSRGEELDPNEIPFLDRTLLKFPDILLEKPREVNTREISKLDTSTLQHIPTSKLLDQWKKPVVPQTPEDDGIDKPKKRSGAMLKLTSSQVERLKNKAMANNHQSSKQGSRPNYSRFEVVAAHIWRCASKALGDDLTQVRFSVNFRNRMNPPLPHNYFGNAVANVATPEGDIISNPLGFAAHKIREASHAVTDEFVKSQLNVSRLGQVQLDNIRAFFMRQGHRVNIPYALNHNVLFLTSFTNMPVYESDFGWGKPVHFGLASRSPADRAAILPSPDGDGVIVALFFQTALMQLFKNYFYEDMYLSLL